MAIQGSKASSNNPTTYQDCRNHLERKSGDGLLPASICNTVAPFIQRELAFVRESDEYDFGGKNNEVQQQYKTTPVKRLAYPVSLFYTIFSNWDNATPTGW